MEHNPAYITDAWKVELSQVLSNHKNAFLIDQYWIACYVFTVVNQINRLINLEQPMMHDSIRMFEFCFMHLEQVSLFRVLIVSSFKNYSIYSSFASTAIRKQKLSPSLLIQKVCFTSSPVLRKRSKIVF